MTVTPAGAAASTSTKPSLTVSTQSKKDEIGIQTLVGDYSEGGTNHGRKYFQKVQKIPGHEDIKVFLYYWDNRDGQDFTGWWFGDQLGGSQVWARAISHGPVPPRVGWKIPWDAPSPEPGILFCDQFKAGAATVAPSAAKPTVTGGLMRPSQPGVVAPPQQPKVPPSTAPTAAAIAERVRKATAQVDATEKECKTILTQAAEATTKATEAAMQASVDALQQKVTSLLELQKSLTTDIAEARKGGVSATVQVTEISKLSPRLRTLQQSVNIELSKMKSKILQAKGKVANAKKEAENKEKNKAQEEADTKEFQETLPASKELANAAEDATEAVSLMASPLIAEPPEGGDDILKRAFEEIEAAAADAQNKITEARKDVTNKLQAARKYAPDTRKNALNEYSAMQTKLTEAQRKLNPFKNFKKEFHARVEARKALSEIADKISEAELEVEKAAMMSSAADSGQMSEDEVQATEKLVTPANAQILATVRTLDMKLRQNAADGAMKDELTGMKDKANAAKKKLEEVVAVLKKQREAVTAQAVIVTCKDKVQKAEEEMAKCQEAEMPFLKGIEVLPPDESTKAISACEAAEKATQTLISQAQGFIRAKLLEAKKFHQDLSKSITEQLTEIQTRSEATSKKLAAFKKDTLERKLAALLSEVVDGVTEAETKVEALTKAAAVFSKENLEEVSVEELKTARTETQAAEKEAQTACLEARKIIGGKQKEASVAKGTESAAALTKMQGRLNTAQQDMAKAKKAALGGEKIIKGKEVLTTEEEAVKKAEEEVDRLHVLANPVEAGLGMETASDEAICDISNSSAALQKTLKASTRNVESQVPGSPPSLKATLQKLAERCKAAQEKLTGVLSTTKDARERVMAEAYIKEGKQKTQEVQDAMEKVNDAELPFLKGIEVLPLQEATDTIKASETAADVVQTAISQARTFIASKNLEVKQYKEAASKPAVEEFAAMTERINAAAAKLGQFRKDTESRKKTALMQEASERIDAAEEQVKKMAEAVKPFAAEATEQLAAEEAEAACEKLIPVSKEVQAKMSAARVFLAERQRENRGTTTFKEQLEKLQARMKAATDELGKHQKVAKEHEQKYAGKKLLIEANEALAGMEAELKKATDACAPLVEHGGEEFLMVTSVHTLSTIVRQHLKEKEMSEENFFKQASKGGPSIPQEAFVAWLEKLPEAIGKDELTFTEARRAAIFKYLDADKDGAVNLAEFKEMFKQRYVCVKTVSVTDDVDISKSKTTVKIEPNEVLEALGAPTTDEGGITRIECSVVSSGKTGFVTLKSNQGTVYLEIIHPFSEYCVQMDKTLEETHKTLTKASSDFMSKQKELAKHKEGPLVEARTELAKLRPKVTSVMTSLDTLKKKAHAEKANFKKKEQAEKTAHIAARERKEAEALTAPAAEKVAAVEAYAKSLEEAAAPLVKVEKDAVSACEKPCSVKEAVDKTLATLTEAVSQARASIKEQQEALPKVAKGAMLEARKDLARMQLKVETALKAARTSSQAVKTACKTIVDAKYSAASSAMRSELQKSGLKLETLFEQLAGKGTDRIPEATFVKKLEALEGLDFKHEQALLLCRHIEIGGIGKRRFFAFLQTYYVVVKAIAITNDFAISSGKTIRKAEADEVMEILEGPKTDEKLGVTRIRGRSLCDGVEGWISVKGNHGTPFLQEVEKPYYSCTEEITMEQEFKSEGAGVVVRTLKADEVLELIEGPRKDTFEPGLRVRGKASSDGAMGWFTVKDKKGVTLAEPDAKIYNCTASVAMTDNMDIKECKVIRKLAVGELFTLEEGPVEQEESGITRVKGKTIKDGKEGWVTTKGNAGTKYAEASTKHYTVLQEVPLQKAFTGAAAAQEVRMLVKGEAMQVLEGPKEEVYPAEVRVKSRALSDGATGWMTLKGDNVKSWSPYYKCIKATPLRAKDGDDAEALRDIAVGETIELLEGPMSGEGKVLRMKARAEKDGAVGYCTIRDAEGKIHLRC